MMCECDGCSVCQPYPKWYGMRPCTGLARKNDRSYFPTVKPNCLKCRQLAEGGGTPPAPGEPPPDVPMTTSLSSASAAPNAKAQMETSMARMEALIDATTSLNSAVVALTARVSRIEDALTKANFERR